jgi:amino acid permease
MVGLIMYTFVTMVGGNPNHDAYGFRYWNNPVYRLPYELPIFPIANIWNQ